MPTLAALTKDLREQWDLLRAWLEELPDPTSSEPSTLPGWSLGVLVAHLGRNLSALEAIQPAAPGVDAEPHSISTYIAWYRTVDPEHIDVNARAYAEEIVTDPLTALDERADAAFAHLDELAAAGEQVVITRNGDHIGLTDFAVTRLLEMVVHAYDLAPTLPLPAPVDPTARTIVAEALLDVLEERTGYQLEVSNETPWILAATGRIDWPTAVERGAVKPSAVSDGTPDLAHSLPLL